MRYSPPSPCCAGFFIIVEFDGIKNTLHDTHQTVKITTITGDIMSKILKELARGAASGKVLKLTGEDIQAHINNGLIKIKDTFPKITIYEITEKGRKLLGEDD